MALEWKHAGRQKDELFAALAGSGALRTNDEGNRPEYVAAVLRDILNRNHTKAVPLDIIGTFLEVPQRTIMTDFQAVAVGEEITKLGTVKVLGLAGNFYGSRYFIESTTGKVGIDGKKYKPARKRSPHESMFTKVWGITSGDYSRRFLVDKKVDLDPFHVQDLM